MPWLADTDVGAAYGFVRSIVGAPTEVELQRRALQALAELVPADVLTWDRVELATGAVHHAAVPVEAQPAGAFEAVVGHAGDHPLLAAHATRRRPALRLSEVVEPGALSRGELYGDLLHAAGVEYEIAIGIRRGRGEAVVAGLGRTERGFSERDRDVLDIARPGLEGALRAVHARGRLVRALADDPPPGTAVVLLDHDGKIELSSPSAGPREGVSAGVAHLVPGLGSSPTSERDPRSNAAADAHEHDEDREPPTHVRPRDVSPYPTVVTVTTAHHTPSHVVRSWSVSTAEKAAPLARRSAGRTPPRSAGLRGQESPDEQAGAQDRQQAQQPEGAGRLEARRQKRRRDQGDGHFKRVIAEPSPGVVDHAR